MQPISLVVTSCLLFLVARFLFLNSLRELLKCEIYREFHGLLRSSFSG